MQLHQGQMEQFSLSFFFNFPSANQLVYWLVVYYSIFLNSQIIKSSDLDALVFVQKQKLKIYFQIQRCTKRVCFRQETVDSWVK